MSFSVVTNVPSLIAQENLRVNNDFQARTIQRLTSGYRINSSGDDAAGLAVANKYRSDVSELTQGVRNANDGISALQIIDGGLNNIAKMLDRLKTLATQSASSTFTGDRNILNNEYSSLLGEIDRQAANIGLGSGDTNATRYNTDIKVFIGGGSQQTNSQVSVNLSSAANLVNATALKLNGTSISGTAVPVALMTAGDLSSGAYLDQNSSQVYHFATPSQTYDVTVMGSVAGLSGNQIVTQLNNGLAGSGITVSLNSTTGRLQASSSSSFVVTVDAATGSGAQIQAAVAVGSAVQNTSRYNFAGGAVTAIAGTGDQLINFTPAGGTTTGVALVNADSIDVVFNKLRAGLSGKGIDVIRVGNNIFFQSSVDFTVARPTDTATGGMAGVGSNSSASATDAATSSDATTNARAALTLIGDAVGLLGTVQGKVGTGQNQLQYAVALAQSQIASFSAAESRIRDADMAAEAANLTKAQVMQQASLAAMAQANAAPQSVLALLRG